MQVKLIYSKQQLEESVKFIAENNHYFLGQKEFIKESILHDMKEMALNPNTNLIGTMGYTIVGQDREYEGIECDENSIRIEILVDPVIGINRDDEEYIEQTISNEE